MDAKDFLAIGLARDTEFNLTVEPARPPKR